MNKTILLLLLLTIPSAIFASPGAPIDSVQPVISSDYLSLLKKDTTAKRWSADSASDLKKSRLKTVGYHYYGIPPVKRISISDSTLRIVRAHNYRLSLSGNYTASVETKRINRQPALQSQYAQGRSAGGKATWFGPETNEIYSYGPSLDQLAFDGSRYPYDINGRLVMKGSGNDHDAISYNNSIFRNGLLLSQAFSIKASITKNLQPLYHLSARIGKSDENLVIKKNRNSSENINFSGGLTTRVVNVGATWQHDNTRFTNSNRNGFLHRAYMQSLLTPASFDNAQGTLLIPGSQRSYSNQGDNPFFLLDDRGRGYELVQDHLKMTADKKLRNLNLQLSQAIEWSAARNNEVYAPGTAGFASGAHTKRVKTDRFYYLVAGGVLDIEYNFAYKLRSTASLKYFFTGSRSNIHYEHSAYMQRRAAHEVLALYSTRYYFSDPRIETKLNLGNKLFFSNTSRRNRAFLPFVDASMDFSNLFDIRGLSLKVSSGLNLFCSEIPVNRSFQEFNLSMISTNEMLQYAPLKEAVVLNKLNVVRQREASIRFEVDFKGMLSLSGGVSARRIRDDVFPVIEAGEISLKNIADHRNRGVDLQLNYLSRYKAKGLTTKTTIAFSSFRSKVMSVKPGYNSLPVAGFSNVNKVIAVGKPLGVIMGSRFLRDANNNIVIGNDGFPLVDPQRGIIADPTPDFVIKAFNGITWKKFHLAADVEWRNGGEAWNGTQAVLDYHGRSATTAALRDTRDYVFTGARQDGSVNNISVRFYDQSISIENNRWVRYGYSGVAEEYIERADHIRINNISLTYILETRKFLKKVSFSLYAGNLVLWSAYSGADPEQLVFDQPGTSGLDFFNLPSNKTFGFNISLQF